MAKKRLPSISTSIPRATSAPPKADGDAGPASEEAIPSSAKCVDSSERTHAHQQKSKDDLFADRVSLLANKLAAKGAKSPAGLAAFIARKQVFQSDQAQDFFDFDALDPSRLVERPTRVRPRTGQGHVTKLAYVLWDRFLACVRPGLEDEIRVEVLFNQLDVESFDLQRALVWIEAHFPASYTDLRMRVDRLFFEVPLTGREPALRLREIFTLSRNLFHLVAEADSALRITPATSSEYGTARGAPSADPLVPQAPTVEDTGNAPTFLRNEKWLMWNRTEQMSPEQIRDRWNNLTNEQRRQICPRAAQKIHNGRKGADLVKKALGRARAKATKNS